MLEVQEIKNEERKIFEGLIQEAQDKGLRGRKLRNYVMNRMKKRWNKSPIK